MPDEVIKDLTEFFEFVWRDEQGYVYLPTINKGQQLTKYMFEWPRQKKGVVKHVNIQDALGNDVFYSPSLFSDPHHPEKEYVKGSFVFWTDLDGNAPDWQEVAEKHGIPEPSMQIASSVEGREHAYWSLANFEADIQQLESRNRAIAYTLGADLSGWDANQFLRPPFTHNYGYKTGGKGERKDWFKGVPVDVTISRATKDRVNPNTFNPLGSPEHIITSRIELGDIPELSQVFMDRRWPEDFRTTFNFTKDEAAASSKEGRSGTLQRLGYFGAENGFTDEEIYAVIRDADDRWEKYSGRRNRDDYLLDIIGRARAKHGYLSAEDITLAGLLGDTRVPVVFDAKAVYSFRELMDLEVNIDWLLENLLRKEGVGIITGPPGVGKTQLGINLLAHMSLGREFLGWNNGGGPKKTFFFSLEMSVIPLKIFWNKVQNQYTDELFDLHKNMHVMPLGEGIALDKEPGQKLFDKMLEEYHPDVVLVDSLQKVTSKELTDELAVKAMLEFLDRMRIKHHCAMIFIHHNRKKGNDNAGSMHVLDDMYGSRYIAANVDFVLNLRSLAKGIVTVDTLKNRLGEERDSFEITRLPTLQYELGVGEAGFLEGMLNGGSGTKERPGDSGEGPGLFGLT